MHSVVNSPLRFHAEENHHPKKIPLCFTYLPLQSSFIFPNTLQNQLEYLESTKEIAVISTDIVLILYARLGKIDIVMILSVPIHEQEISLHMFTSLISIISILQFSSYSFSAYFVIFMLQYLMFWGYHEWNYFFILIFSCSLLIYKKLIFMQ